MSVCLAPACAAVSLGLGPFGFLCVPHALAVAQAAPGRPQAPERPDMRGRCWGALLACPEPAVTATPHGRWCAEHRPAAAPVPPERAASTVDALGPALLAGAALTMRGLGATLLRTESTYGAVEGEPGAEVIAARPCARSAPRLAVTLEPDDERAPRNARSLARAAAGAGWSVRLRWVAEADSLVLRAWRGPLLVVASWEGGKFEAGWAQRGRDLPVRLGARQVTALVKAAP